MLIAGLRKPRWPPGYDVLDLCLQGPEAASHGCVGSACCELPTALSHATGEITGIPCNRQISPSYTKGSK